MLYNGGDSGRTNGPDSEWERDRKDAEKFSVFGIRPLLLQTKENTYE